MERTVVYQVEKEDLRNFLAEEIAKRDISNPNNSLLKKFENVFVDPRVVATIHNVSVSTVRNYINDRLIEPETREVERGRYKFRLNYVLTLDFKKLKKQLKERTCK